MVPNTLPDEAVTRAIKQAVEQGLVFSLASGRPFSMIQYLVEHLGKVGHCIVDNGAVIVDSENGTVLWEVVLPNSHANRILELAKSFELVRASCDTGGIDNPTKIPLASKVRKISIHDISIDRAEELMGVVNLELKDVTGSKAASYKGKNLVDVYFSDINATKQNAVFKLLEMLDIPREQTIGVGDGYNDFPLLMACGYKIAMGNSVDELKAIADYVAPTVEEGGLVDIIERFCLT